MHGKFNSGESKPSLRELSGGLFFISFGLLLLEITLTRIFSFAISYHFAYLTIATAMLGFGSAGSVLAAWPHLFGDERRRFVVCAGLSGIGASAALAFSSVVRFHPQQLGSDPLAVATLGAYYVVVAVPFLFGGISVATAIASRPDRVSRLYGWDLVGAGLGCGLSVPLMWVAQTPATVVIAATAIAASGLCLCAPVGALRRFAVASSGAAAALGVLAATVGPFPPASGKFLAYFLDTPGVEHLYQRWTPLSRVDAVGWKKSESSWRGSYATSGVSETFAGRGPDYRMVGYDGGSFAVMYESDGDPRDLDVFRHHVMAAPYVLLDEPSALIIGLGGGADALAGLANGVGPITALELNPITVELGKRDYAEFNGGLFNRDDVDVVAAEARHWIEAHDDRFDLIVLNSIDTLSALSSGAYVLAESYLYTVEAFRAYLDRLQPGGMFALFSYDNNGIAGPTYIIQRFAMTLVDALREEGATDAASRIFILASRDELPFVATLVKREPYSAEELDALLAFAERERFDVWHRPDRATAHSVGELIWSDDERRAALQSSHYLRLDPATDGSPFFFNFYKWKNLVFRHADDAGGTPATGQRMLLIMLVQAVVIAAVMTLWPLRRLRRDGPVHKPLGFMLYFAALGLGFILLEISILQRFVLFLGFPTYSLSVVLLAVLVSTGLGSALSARITGPVFTRVRMAALVVVAFVACFVAFGPPLLEGALDRPLAVRVAISLAALAPLGLLLGVFFPLGIRAVERIDRRLVPWAWAINGCAGVVGTIATVMIAMAYGFDATMVLAAAIYVTGAFAFASVGDQQG